MKNTIKAVTKNNKGIKIDKEAKQEEVKQEAIKQEEVKKEGKTLDTNQMKYTQVLQAHQEASRTLKKVTYSNALVAYALCNDVIAKYSLTIDNVKDRMKAIFEEGKIKNQNREGECPIHRVEFVFAVLCSIATNRTNASSTLMQSITEISNLRNRGVIKEIFPAFKDEILDIVKKACYKF